MRGLGTIALVWTVFAGCGLFENEGMLEGPASVPHRGSWEVVLEASMPLTGISAIERIRVGGLEYEGNFANRGDIVVDTWDEPRIRVQMRPFTRSIDPTLAAEELERFELWAFATEGAAPQREENMLVPRPCVNDTGELRDGCALRVLYEGHLQPARTGVDLWVTVPSQWTGDLELYTEDNDHDGDYLNRGNICVEGSRAVVNAELESGIGLARLIDGSTMRFKSQAANVTFDVPAEVTSRLSALVTPDDDLGLLCSTYFEVDNFVHDASSGPDGERTGGVAGPQPHAQTPTVSASAFAKACLEQASIESPDDYIGPGEIGPITLHGEIQFCNDCLPEPCSQLLPGFE